MNQSDEIAYNTLVRITLMLKGAMQKKIYVTDLFCEIGGLVHVLQIAKVNVIAEIGLAQTFQHLFGSMRYCRHFLKDTNSQWTMKQHQCRRWHIILAMRYKLTSSILVAIQSQRQHNERK